MGLDTLAYFFIIVVLVGFMYFQVIRSRDRGQRGRALQTLAKHFECDFDVVVPAELRHRLEGVNIGQIRTMRNHFSCSKSQIPIDIIDIRYAFSKGRMRNIATSTVGRFDYSGPAFRCAPRPDPQPLRITVPADNAGQVDLENAAFNESRLLTGSDADSIRSALRPDFVEAAANLGDTIVESDGKQVILYGWRTRVLPAQFPDFRRMIIRVASTLR